MDGNAVARIVVQATSKDKKAICQKAKDLSMPISELMRRGAFAYQSEDGEEELELLADTAKSTADSAARSIDDALAFIAASNRRIAGMEIAAKSNRSSGR